METFIERSRMQRSTSTALPTSKRHDLCVYRCSWLRSPQGTGTRANLVADTRRNLCAFLDGILRYPSTAPLIGTICSIIEYCLNYTIWKHYSMHSLNHFQTLQCYLSPELQVIYDSKLILLQWWFGIKHQIKDFLTFFLFQSFSSVIISDIHEIYLK